MVSLTMLGWIVGVERVKDRSLWVGSRWQAPLKGRGGGGTRWQRSSWTWNTSLSMDTSGIYLQTQKCMQNAS